MIRRLIRRRIRSRTSSSSFTQKETEFAAARESYTYRQTSKITETDPPGGNYQIVEEVSFDNRNRRTSHVTHAPVTSLQNIQMTAEDEQDMRNVMPFVMTNDTASDYNVKYLRREKVDEIPCFVFSVEPKTLTKDRKRYFDGQIWVDDQDMQIVKTFGRATGYLQAWRRPAVSEIRNLPGADRRQVLVPNLYLRRRHFEFQRRPVATYQSRYQVRQL